MKKFNKLTEKKMSKVNGGFLIPLLVAGGTTIAGMIIGIGAGEATKKDKN